MQSLVLLTIFSNTPFEYGQHGIVGLKYDALKDQVKWNGLSPKKYVNMLQTCINMYIKGTNKKGK